MQASKQASPPTAAAFATTVQARAVSASAAGGDRAGSGGKPKGRRIPERIGVIGAGQMGEALIRGFISSGISSPGRISCSIKELERRQLLEGAPGAGRGCPV